MPRHPEPVIQTAPPRDDSVEEEQLAEMRAHLEAKEQADRAAQEWVAKQQQDHEAALKPKLLTREPFRFVVVHGVVGHHLQGTIVTEEQLGQCDLERLVDLGALLPIPREDPMAAIKAALAEAGPQVVH